MKITQAHLDAVGEPIESITIPSDISGIQFITVTGGMVRIYNSYLNQALPKKYSSVQEARQFLIRAGVIERVKG